MKFFVYDNVVTAVRFHPNVHHQIKFIHGTALPPGENPHGVLDNGARFNVDDWLVTWPTGDVSVFSETSFKQIFSECQSQDGQAEIFSSTNADERAADSVVDEDAIESVPTVGAKVQRKEDYPDGPVGTVSCVHDANTISVDFGSVGCIADVRSFVFLPTQAPSDEQSASPTVA